MTGEWLMHDDDHSLVYGLNESGVIQFSFKVHAKTPEIAERVARLCKAAPKLLAAVISAERWIDPDTFDRRLGRDVRDELRAVIAEATGAPQC